MSWVLSCFREVSVYNLNHTSFAQNLNSNNTCLNKCWLLVVLWTVPLYPTGVFVYINITYKIMLKTFFYLLQQLTTTPSTWVVSLGVLLWISLLPAHRDAQKQCKKKKYFAGLGSWPLVKRKEEDLKSKNLTQFVYSPLRDWEFME